MREFFKGWKGKLSLASLLACMLITGALRRFMLVSGPIEADLVSEDADISGTGNEDFPSDLTKYEGVFEERDPTTGVSCFSINGSPVRGKLKAFLDDHAKWEGAGIIGMKTHPDGEPVSWVMIPKPLFLSLTDQSPSP